MKKAQQLWPELSSLSNTFLKQYPSPISGAHRLFFESGRLICTLIYDDALTALKQFEFKAHAWFLDGFAPRCNPELWSEELCQMISQHSQDKTSLATFSAAGHVKRALIKADFKVQKVKGFAMKREMITAEYIKDKGTKSFNQPWYTYPTYRGQKKATIIGGGMAGTSIAYQLAKRDWQVNIYEKKHISNGASGNLSALIQPFFCSSHNPLEQFRNAAYLYTHHFFQHESSVQSITKNLKGVKHPVLNHEDEKSFFIKRELFKHLPKSFVSFEDHQKKEMVLPESGWVSPVELCQRLIQHPNINVIENCSIHHFQKENNGEWSISNETNSCLDKSPVLIIANAYDASFFSFLSNLNINNIRGQLTYLPSHIPIEQSISHHGHIVPYSETEWHLGATYDLNSSDQSLRDDDHLKNIKTLEKFFPEEFKINLKTLNGRVSFRCSTPDLFPIIGPIPNTEFFKKHYSDLHLGKAHSLYPKGETEKGIYCSIAHGSKGITTSLFGAEILACQITGEPLPISKKLESYLLAARFDIKKFLKHN